MHVPKAHPVSISDELSGGSRYFGAASIFGAASESQESTGLFWDMFGFVYIELFLPLFMRSYKRLHFKRLTRKWNLDVNLFH